MPERLDKFIASQQTVTRREATRLIRSGQVAVDGVFCRDPAAKICPETAAVTVSGQAVSYRRQVYWMLNKPAGILCVSRDPRVKTVVDLLPKRERRKGLFPAGRLDKDSVGLVILTDDGDFAHRLISPKNEVPKRYLVRVDAPLSDEDIKAFADGIVLADGTLCRPAGLTVVEPGDNPVAEVIITEGRYHQIKRMFGVRERGVLWLKRVAIGGLSLDETLAPGEARLLTEREKNALLEC